MKQSVLVSTCSSQGGGLAETAPIASGAVSDDLVHDLRQPLGAIEALAYYLELTGCDEKTRYQAQQIQVMVKKANRILSAACSGPAKDSPVVLARAASS